MVAETREVPEMRERARRNRLGPLVIGLVALVVVLAGAAFYNSATALTYDGLVARLRANGASVTPQSSTSTAGFFSVGARDITVNGAALSVFEYALPLAADADARGVSMDGTTITSGFGPWHRAAAIDWLAPPHYFKDGRVIVVYIGDNAEVIAALTRVMGPQFAGGA
jgi:hypothetical protein